MTVREKQKKEVHELHDKYYKDKKKPESKASISVPVGSSRNALMLQAKANGIKNFRVLNKAELAECLADGITKERIDAIVSGAVARWKAGWGSKAREAGSFHKE
jgi:hypothetical protein